MRKGRRGKSRDTGAFSNRKSLFQVVLVETVKTTEQEACKSEYGLLWLRIISPYYIVSVSL